MKRSGFTMVELIFVIVIIGILAATALPRFSGVKDRAKVNSELAALSGLDGAITATKEFRADDYNDDNISWHNSNLANSTDDDTAQAAQYQTINNNKKVMNKIAKKTDSLRIVGFFLSDGDDVNASGNSTPYKNSILLLKGIASNELTGVSVGSGVPGGDLYGKPDKNDVWVFNPNNWDVNITSSANTLHQATIVIPSQSIDLVDVNGSLKLSISGLTATKSDGGSAGNSAIPVN